MVGLWCERTTIQPFPTNETPPHSINIWPVPRSALERYRHSANYFDSYWSNLFKLHRRGFFLFREAVAILKVLITIMSLLRLSRVPAQLLTPSIRWSARGCVYYSSETSSHSDNNDMKLEGLWHNELGSCMMIESAKDGMLTGWYNTKVGEAKRKYVLTGRYDHLKCRRTLGWTVTWVNEYYSKSESTTSWSGQYQVDPVGRRTTHSHELAPYRSNKTGRWLELHPHWARRLYETVSGRGRHPQEKAASQIQPSSWSRNWLRISLVNY